MGSSRTRDQARAPCIGRWILNNCATKEAPPRFLYIKKLEWLFQKEIEETEDIIVEYELQQIK